MVSIFLYGDTTYKYLGHNFPSDFTVCVRQVSSAQIPIVEQTRVSGHTWVPRSEYNIDVNGFFIAYPLHTQLPKLVSYHVFGHPCGHT